MRAAVNLKCSKLFMNKIFNNKYWWVWLAAAVTGINLLAIKFHKRLDLTSEKRYSLSAASKQVLKNLKEDVNIEVFLKGNFPAGFKRLTNSTREFLEECREYSGGRLQVIFKDPFDGLSDSAVYYLKDSMRNNYELTTFLVGDIQVKTGKEAKQVEILPGASVSTKQKTEVINFLKGVRAIGTKEEELAEMYNDIEATLEYKIISAINKVTTSKKPVIAYAVGNGQPGPPLAAEALTAVVGWPFLNPDAVPDTINNTYLFNTINIPETPFIPEKIDVLIIQKPQKAFTDGEKLKIDQYVMRGGNVFWLLDNMYTEFDSLMRSKEQSFIAFDKGLNLDDMLFKYGVRINQVVSQDMYCDKLPQLVGDANQQTVVDFPSFPILFGTDNGISKNLNGVRALFPQSIDTVKADGIKKTILLTTGTNSRTIGTPVKIDFSAMKYAPETKDFPLKHIPAAVLLEGKFSSFYKNRLLTNLKDSLDKYQREFLAEGVLPGKQIVVADGDVALNFMSPKNGIIPIGMTALSIFSRENSYQFANKDFFLNCIEYLSGNDKLIETRSKNFTLRLLDPAKKEAQEGKWKLLAVAVPVLLVLLAGFLFGWIRKRKYALRETENVKRET
jgi:ABC-2 type transport system permease protein